MNIRDTLKALGYVGSSEIKTMKDSDVLLVHSAILSERLRGCDVDHKNENRRRLFTKIERILYGTGAQRSESMVSWSSRVSMTVSEVRVFFDSTDGLPVRALKRKSVGLRK